MRTGEIILHEKILGTVIDWTAGTAFANATQMGAKYGKRPNDFLLLASTRDYIQAIANDLGLPAAKLPEKLVVNCPGKIPQFPGIVETIEGRNGGTWMHPYLALEFARWCSPEFGLACNKVIIRILSGGQAETLYSQMTLAERRIFKLRLKLDDAEHRRQMDANRRKRDAMREAETIAGHVAVREWLTAGEIQLSQGEVTRLSIRLASEARRGSIEVGAKTIRTNTLARVARVPTYAPEAIAAVYAELFPALIEEASK